MYKNIVKKEIDNILAFRIIYPVDQYKWANPMVIQPKKNDPKKLQVWVNFRWLNKVTLKDPFPTPLLMKSLTKS